MWQAMITCMIAGSILHQPQPGASDGRPLARRQAIGSLMVIASPSLELPLATQRDSYLMLFFRSFKGLFGEHFRCS